MKQPVYTYKHMHIICYEFILTDASEVFFLSSRPFGKYFPHIRLYVFADAQYPRGVTSSGVSCHAIEWLLEK